MWGRWRMLEGRWNSVRGACRMVMGKRARWGGKGRTG